MNQGWKVVRVAAWLLPVLVTSGVVWAGPADKGPKLVETPSADAFARFYPERAQRFEVGGTATIACTSTEVGLLKDCTATHEWPQGFGFGEAALRLTPFFRLSGAGPFKTHIRFSLADDGDDPLYLQGVPQGQGDNRWQIQAKPTPEQLAAAYPGHAVDLFFVPLSCTLTAQGRLDGCAPDKPGFAPEVVAAAKSMALLYRTNPPPPYLVGKTTLIVIDLIPPDPGDGDTPAK